MARLLLLSVSLLLCLHGGTAQRLLKAAAPLDCRQLHPECTSCAVKRTVLNGLPSSYAQLVCKSCSLPSYKVYSTNDTNTTCGE